jgi:hypothetical protein
VKQFTVTIAIALLVGGSGARAQETEAGAGFSLGGTFSGLAAASTDYEKAPRSGSVADAGVRLMLYPTWKLEPSLDYRRGLSGCLATLLLFGIQFTGTRTSWKYRSGLCELFTGMA